jgi:SAM-dependent methyltransferase
MFSPEIARFFFQLFSLRLPLPDFTQRAHLTELMDAPCSRDVLRGCLRDIARTNSWTLGYRPVMHWLNAVTAAFPARPEVLRILDVGSGYGDGLRRIEQWARARRIAVELVGLDLNPDATAIASQVTTPSSRIHWITGNILTYSPPKPPHLVLSSLFTHHLTEAELVQFLKWMEAHTLQAWFINDLSRAAIPYHLFRAFSKLMRLHRFVQHDGPISVARSFIPSDWQRLCAAAGLKPGDYAIQPFKPGRLCVARSKPVQNNANQHDLAPSRLKLVKLAQSKPIQSQPMQSQPQQTKPAPGKSASSRFR